MTGRVAPALLLLIGAVVFRLTTSGRYLDYVKPSHGPLLIAAAVMLVACGGVGIVRDLRHPGTGTSPPTGGRVLHTHGPLRADPATIAQDRRERLGRAHDHSQAPGVAALWVLPIFLALMVPPPALGAYAAARAGAAVPEPVARRDYGPLPDTAAGIPLTVHDYAERATWDRGRTLIGRTVVLTGFATPDPDGGWYLSRMMITCCAADSRSYLVQVTPPRRVPPANTWFRITGSYAPGSPSPDGRARIVPIRVDAVAAPDEPYELP